MDRRDLLALAGGSLAAAVAGCLGDDSTENVDTPEPTDTPADDPDDASDDGSDAEDGSPDGTGDDTGSGGDDGTTGDDGSREIPGEPLATVDRYVEAIDNEDEEAAIDLLHEDSELTPENVARDIAFFAGADVTLVQRGFADFSEREITARGILDVQGKEEGPMTVGLELTLKQIPSGRWRIVDGRATRLDTGDSGQDDDQSGDGDADDAQDGDQSDGNETQSG